MAGKTYKIGEVADILNLKSYVLRFWETEFSQIAPLRTGKGQRFYSENDVALLKRIKNLLHEQGMTIEGARKILSGKAQKSPDPLYFSQPAKLMPKPESPMCKPVSDIDTKFIKEELLAVRNILITKSK